MSTYTLYSYFRSSCSARLRIVLNFKNISYETLPVDLLGNAQLSEAHLSLNPSASVPLLCRQTGNEVVRIGQSIAAIEYLDEIHPDNPLLPPRSNPELRATVRVLVNIIAADVQPLANLRVIRRVKNLGGNVEEWCREFMRNGLAAYEAIIRDHSDCDNCYSVGNQMTIADVCLVPAVWSAERYGLDLNEFPEISRVVKALQQHPAIIAAHWRRQLDTPTELRLQCNE